MAQGKGGHSPAWRAADSPAVQDPRFRHILELCQPLASSQVGTPFQTSSPPGPPPSPLLPRAVSPSPAVSPEPEHPPAQGPALLPVTPSPAQPALFSPASSQVGAQGPPPLFQVVSAGLPFCQHSHTEHFSAEDMQTRRNIFWGQPAATPSPRASKPAGKKNPLSHSARLTPPASVGLCAGGGLTHSQDVLCRHFS